MAAAADGVDGKERHLRLGKRERRLQPRRNVDGLVARLLEDKVLLQAPAQGTVPISGTRRSRVGRKWDCPLIRRHGFHVVAFGGNRHTAAQPGEQPRGHYAMDHRVASSFWSANRHFPFAVSVEPIQACAVAHFIRLRPRSAKCPSGLFPSGRHFRLPHPFPGGGRNATLEIFIAGLRRRTKMGFGT